ncbi:MAG: DUF637 domain-containing protein [Rhodoferax sp.]|nr:DUF637 domain-containing protein [Rhodoferax sp.]
MNRNLFRLVFNAARGLVMAVSEVASSSGKSASGETKSGAAQSLQSNRPLALVEYAQAAIKSIVVAFALLGLPLALQAQIIADPSAAGNLKPQIFTTANGVTQVNIQTPSAGGVSRNVYSQFDVNAQGAILNNSTSNVQTQLGGWVQSNGNLAGGAARIILNEVNSSNPSQLKGFVEVAGQRAEVIIANPAGINVNGGGFINASGVTLTTGTPQLTGGNLDGYRVQAGEVNISGAGLDSSTADFTHIIARAVQVNAGIWAKDLKVTTGANTVNAANTTATAIAGTGVAPTVALDVAALGGMYAGKITLVGTEAGVGVNNAGSIVARGGDLVLSSSGILTNRGLIDAGNTAASTQTRITATTVNNLGTGAIFGDKVGISADTLNNQAESAGGTVSGATIGARTSLNIGVQTLNNSDMGLDTPANPSANTTATASVNILSLGDIHIGGSLDAAGQAQGRADSINNRSATIQAGGNITLTATAVNNTDAHFASVDQTTTTAITETIGSAPSGYYVNVTQQTVSGPVVTAALPGTISAAGDLTLQADTVDNANSRMLAGGTVSIPAAVTVNNAGVPGTLITTKSGTAYTLLHDRSCDLMVKSTCLAWGPWYDYWQASGYSSAVPETITAGAGVTTSGAATAAPGVPGTNVANSSLYQINTSPSANYVVATNPAFTNYKTWLGSDYMLTSLALDPTVTQKRLGDGFYEQRLLNEQIAQLTGRRFLDNFTSDDQQYRALMDAGVTYAQAFNLRPGIALSAEQIAVLTSDIVWLQQETVTLPDGTKILALVPQVYLAPRSGDLSPSGGLISGAALNITSSGDTINSGTLLGRKVVQINANNLNNLGGNIQGDAVALAATQDINNTGGRIAAQDQLVLSAGRDINSNSTTATASTGDSRNGVTNTVVGRVAGLYVSADAGILLASAGRDINLIASTIRNSGAHSQTVLNAQNDINLSTLQTSQTNNLERDSGNFRRATSTAEAGSTITTQGSVSLSAGNDVNARAAQVAAGKALDVAAGNNIILQAGQATTNVDQMASASGQDLFFTSSIQTRRQSSSATAQVSSFTGQSTQLVADNNLISIGAKLEATGLDNGTGTLRVEGKNNTALYEVQNFSQSSVTTHTKTDLGPVFSTMLDPLGFGTPVEEKTVTDARASSTSIGTKLISTQKIEIGVGNSTELRGAQVEAPQIAFIQTDPTKAGELILSGSIDTTQTSHTEKTETMGLYQEMKGKGSTTETLNQTQLKGNVSFDNALKITVQIPDTQGGQELKAAINALAAQGSGVGLDYLNALANNPQVDWEKVALAHDKWSYDQGGLTGAGAALLTIVVTYFTAGMGSGLVGGTAATAGTAATVAGSTALATAVNAGFSALASQTAVAMVNNKGDIGKTLEQLGSEKSVQNLLLTMVTAGALDKLNSTMGWQEISPKTADFASNFGKNIANNFASASINSALTGSSLEDGLQAALLNSVVSTSMAFGAKAIGTMTLPDANGNATLNPAGQALAHALLGCVSGAATAGNSSGCTPGAAGALVGELAAKWYDPTGNKTDAEVLAFVRVVSATAGALTGDGSAQSVNTAAATGVNAVQNNFLETRDIKYAVDKLKTCTVGCDALRRVLVGEGAQRNVGGVQSTCKANPQACTSQVQEIAAALKDLQNPEIRTVLGEATTDRLIQRQVSDLGRAVDSLQWGSDHLKSSQLVVKAALVVGATAVGAPLLVSIARTFVAACGSGVTTPACSALSTEMGIAASEAISGIPTLGLSAPTAALAASRLKAVIPTNDTAAIAKEMQVLLAEFKAEQVAVNQTVKVGANGGARIESLAANDVRFSQNTVSYNKVDRISGEKYTYDDLVQSMKTGGWKGDPVDVVKMPDGAFTSMDNTRISAARDAGINVQANVHGFNDPLPADMIANRRFGDATTWGEALTGRISNQKPPSFGNANPNGSPTPPKVTGKP